MLPIGDDGVGNPICLDLSAAHFGAIYFLDLETHFYDDPDSMEGMIRLADSFTEFLSLLCEDPE